MIHSKPTRIFHFWKFLVVCCLLLLVDWFIVMPKRLHGVWEYQSGHYVGDPIAYRQHFVLKNRIIFFKKYPEKKLLLIGCYFGEFVMLDLDDNGLVHYARR
jgi:hypothetical protein